MFTASPQTHTGQLRSFPPSNTDKINPSHPKAKTGTILSIFCVMIATQYHQTCKRHVLEKASSYLSTFNIQKYHCFESRETCRYRKQFFPGLDTKYIEIKLSRPPQRSLYCAQEGYLPSLKYHNLANKYS